jgi:hypothetical protein
VFVAIQVVYGDEVKQGWRADVDGDGSGEWMAIVFTQHSINGRLNQTEMV